MWYLIGSISRGCCLIRQLSSIIVYYSVLPIGHPAINYHKNVSNRKKNIMQSHENLHPEYFNLKHNMKFKKRRNENIPTFIGGIHNKFIAFSHIYCRLYIKHDDHELCLLCFYLFFRLVTFFANCRSYIKYDDLNFVYFVCVCFSDWWPSSP